MSKKSHKALASATVMSLILTSTLTATVSAATGVERLYGSNRETTAIDVATKVFEKAETVVIVNGYKSADALSATPLAKALNAPILSVNTVDVPSAALTKALADLGAKKVVVVGGEGAVTKALAEKLAETYTVERIAGANRYETNVNVAKKVMELKESTEAFVVNGLDKSYADALSVASIAASKGAPIVFTDGKTVSEEAKALVKDLKVTAIGGTGVVSAEVLEAVDATRVGGADRFATNLEVLKAYKDVIKLDNVFVAYGLNFADALVASAAAAKTDAPVVLADKTNTKFTEGATDYIKANKDAIKNVYLVGGTGVIGDSVKNAIDGVVNPVLAQLAIESVTSINADTLKITFNKEVEDINEIETDGDRFVIYNAEDRLVDATNLSTNIAFESDKKTAVVTFASSLTVGQNYRIALVDDSSNLFAATVLATTSKVVLPEVNGGNVVTPDEDSDRKFTVKFAKAMGSDALDLTKYKILDANNNIIEADASDALDAVASPASKTNPSWDTTTTVARTQFDFYVNQGTLEAGKTYKLVANTAIAALDSTSIKANTVVTTFSTPALSKVQPKVATARIVDADTIEIYFDKAVTNVGSALAYISALKENGVDITSKINTAGLTSNVLTIDLASGSTFASNKSYTVSLNSRLAVSVNYTNAYNAAVTDYKVEAVKNVAPVLTSVGFVRQSGDKEKADLKFVFDRAVSPVTGLATGNITIETLGATYTSAASVVNLELDTTDPTNKTLLLKDVANGTNFASFTASELSNTSDYKITLKAGSVAVNTLAASPETNAKKDLTVKGIDVAQPGVKSITYVSATEIRVKFDETINASDLKESHITVQGFYKAYGDRYYAPKALTGSDFITFTVSGDTITIKAKDASRTVFQTGKINGVDVVSILANKIKDVNGIKLTSAVNESAAVSVVDKLAPMMILTESTSTNDEVKITFTEDIAQVGSAPAGQFIIAGAKANDGTVGQTAATIVNNTITVTFTAGSVDASTAYKDATIRYVRNNAEKITDTESTPNDAALQTITGIK